MAPAKSCPGPWATLQGQPLPFFQEEISNATVYVAPREVQEKVIASWKAWGKKNDRGFAPRPHERFEAWYW